MNVDPAIIPKIGPDVVSPAPPLERQPRRIVVLLGAKLIGLDSILPVIFELKSEAPDIDVRFVFVNAQALQDVRSNYVLFDGMAKIGRIHALSPGRGRSLDKARAILRLAGWVVRLASSPTLLLGYTDFATFPFNLLARAARLRGAAVLYAKAAFPESAGFRQAMSERHSEADLMYRDIGDAQIVYHPEQIKDLGRHADGPALIAGTPRDLPAWRRYLDETLKTRGVTDEAGRRFEITDGPVLALFYPGDHVLPTLAKPTSCRDQLRSFFKVLAATAPAATVLIKPHSICDRDELAGELAAFRELRCRITDAHPQLLARIATAAVFVNGSNVMNDMYMEGVPVIELSDYRPDIRTSVQTLYPHPLRIGARTDAAMRAALGKVLKGFGTGEARQSGLVWPKAPSLARLLWREAS